MAVVILTYLLTYYAAALTLILLFMGYVSIMASTTIVWMDRVGLYTGRDG